MDNKDQKPASKAGNQAQSAPSTLRKSKRRNRNKKPSTVAVDPQPVITPSIPSTGQLKSNPAPAAPSQPASANATPDLKQATAQVLEEVKKVISQVIPAMEKKADEKDRDQVKAEREAKRLAKKNKKQGGTDAQTPSEPASKAKPVAEKSAKVPTKAKDPAQDKPKQKTPAPAKETKSAAPALTKSNTDTELSAKLESLHLSEKPAQDLAAKEKPQLSKAERRAIQEAQRAAKTKALAEKAAAQTGAKAEAASGTKKPTEPAKAKGVSNVAKVFPKRSAKKLVVVKKPATHRVKLFSHLYLDKQSPEDLLLEISDSAVHPAIIQLGVQQSEGTIIGANSRCIAFLNALKMVIMDFVPPPQKIFSRSLESVIQTSMVYLQKCRPISVSMANALRALKGQINHLPDSEKDKKHKRTLCEFIDTYIRDQIEKAALAISEKLQEKICTGDVILTYGCSSLIKHILEGAHSRNVDFRVIVVDSRPLNEGQEMLRRLTAMGIRCCCVLINAVSFVMPEVTKVLVGAHALLANGYVMSRTGTAQVAMVAKSYNVPVLVCCETHKFSERVQTDAFVYNEIGNPNDLVKVNGVQEGELALKGWSTMPHLTPLHLYYDITPPELVAAVVTEVAILPCTSVPVILRIKPTEVWY